MSTKAFARVYCLIARQARTAVIFRRGPSKQVLLLGWDLETDRIVEGQWLKGRIYERICDLSPDGSKLVYFAANQRPPIFSWTAVSTPPWLKAHHFFPQGDCQGGGGLFDANNFLRINHIVKQPEQSRPLDKKGRRIPRYMRDSNPGHFELTPAGFDFPGLKVMGFGPTEGVGGYEPVETQRLERDGWVRSNTLPAGIPEKITDDAQFERHPPVAWIKESRFGNIALCVVSHGIHETNGAWYIETAYLLKRDGLVVMNTFGRIDWADMDHNGDVLFSKAGRLCRLKSVQAIQGHCESFVEIADLNELKFEERIAPY